MRTYRLLLRLLPRWFAQQHGDAMTEVFATLHAQAVLRGRNAVMRLWLREAWDLSGTSVRLRLRTHAAFGDGTLRRVKRRQSSLAVLRDDARLAYRSLVRQSSFFLLAALTLALGIGATTAMYSALRAVVLDPLPYENADRLVTPWLRMGDGDALIGFNEPAQVAHLRDQRHIFAAIAEYGGGGSVTITGHGEPQRVRAVKMTPELPALLGLEPLLGRTSSAQEEGARVVVLSHALWQSLYGARRDVIGRELYVDGQGWTIIGVMPRRAPRPDGSPLPADLWIPLRDRDWDRLPLAQLADGVTVEQAAARMDAMVRELSPKDGGTVQPAVRTGPLHDHLRVLMVAVLLLLLIAGVNVSSLLVHRALAREAETATRLALGAGRGRLMLHVMLESTFIALTGGVLGAAFAYGVLRALAAISPEQLAALAQVRVDGVVLAFCCAISVVVGVLFGLLPALYATRADARATLGRRMRRASASPARFRWSLVAVQVALSFVLLASATLVLTLLRNFAARDPGFRADGLIALDVRLPSWRYADETGRRLAFTTMLDDVRRIRGVQSAALANGAPPKIQTMLGRLTVQKRPREASPRSFHWLVMDTGFLAVLAQPLIAGRGFGADDAKSADKPALLAESAARHLFGSTNVIGQRFSFEGDDPYTVVGVVADIRATGLGEEKWRPLAYEPLTRVSPQMTILVRAAQPDARLLLTLRQLVRTHEPDAIANVATIPELLGATLARERFTSALLAAFALLALVLAAVGLYGLVAQLVVSRTHEIGVRIALGARADQIVRLIAARGITATCAGLVIGAPLLLLSQRLLREPLAIVSSDPAAYGLAALLLLLTAVAASAVPAFAAARLEPRRAIDAE